jgi:uncharacterized protein YceK
MAKAKLDPIHTCAILCAILFCFLPVSCSTIEQLENKGLESVPYQGTYEDLEMIARGKDETIGYVLVALGAIDLPFSFFADTLLIPANLFHWAFLEEGHSNCADCAQHNQRLQPIAAGAAAAAAEGQIR